MSTGVARSTMLRTGIAGWPATLSIVITAPRQ